MDQVLLLCPRPLISLYVSIWASPLDLWYPRPRFRGWTGGSRAAGSAQGDAMRRITGVLGQFRWPSAISGSSLSNLTLGGDTTAVAEDSITKTSGILTFDSGAVVTTATENRPINIAVPVILYLGISV